VICGKRLAQEGLRASRSRVDHVRAVVFRSASPFNNAYIPVHGPATAYRSSAHAMQSTTFIYMASRMRAFVTSSFCMRIVILTSRPLVRGCEQVRGVCTPWSRCFPGATKSGRSGNPYGANDIRVTSRGHRGSFPRRQASLPRRRTTLVRCQGKEPCARSGMSRRRGKSYRRQGSKHLDAEENFLVVSPLRFAAKEIFLGAVRKCLGVEEKSLVISPQCLACAPFWVDFSQ